MIDRNRVFTLFYLLGEAVIRLPEPEMRAVIEGMMDGTSYTGTNSSVAEGERVTACYVCGGVEGCMSDCPADALWEMLK